MIKRIVAILGTTVLAVSLVACGGKDEAKSGEAAAGVELDGGQKFLVSSGTKSLAKVEEKLKGDKPISVVGCAVVRAGLEKLDGVENAEAKAFVAKGKKVCGYQVLVHNIKLWKAKVEVKAGEKFNGACYNVAKKDLKKLLETHPDDATVKEVAAYIEKTCPKNKKN
jgi:hypothetical protein